MSRNTPKSTQWQCPEENALAAAQAFLAEHNVQYLLAQFVDIHGGIKSKCVPAHCLESLLTTGAGFAGAAVQGFTISPQDPEYMLVGDLSTLTLLTWLPGYAVIRGRGQVADKDYPLDCRNVLLKQTDRLKERGWAFMTGLEPEFYLVKRDDNDQVVPFDSSDTLAKPTYDYQGITRNTAFLEALHQSLEATGLKVYQIDHEDANGQFELNFDYDEALKTADNIQLFKMSAKEIAHRNGAICSFLPKLSSTTTGNGMHVHCSMQDELGTNLFHDANDPNGMGLSKLAYQFLAGVTLHAKALTALLCPSVNSYKRLVSGTPERPSWAPVYIAYGDNNRSAMLRIPYGRIEIRIGDSSMNAYLATAAIIAAGLHGIEQELTPSKPINTNFFTLTHAQVDELGVERLPETLNEALDELASDLVLQEALGPELINAFIAIKRTEWQEYHRHVSEWELNRYLEFY
ncbi:type III glutamate--ammonia ligase [Sessilibacter sp. MAH4]